MAPATHLARLLTLCSAPAFSRREPFVSAAGIVLVTFKSQASVPPYRIENMCADVAVAIAQAPLEFMGRAQWCAALPLAPLYQHAISGHCMTACSWGHVAGVGCLVKSLGLEECWWRPSFEKS